MFLSSAFTLLVMEELPPRDLICLCRQYVFFIVTFLNMFKQKILYQDSIWRNDIDNYLMKIFIFPSFMVMLVCPYTCISKRHRFYRLLRNHCQHFKNVHKFYQSSFILIVPVSSALGLPVSNGKYMNCNATEDVTFWRIIKYL